MTKINTALQKPNPKGAPPRLPRRLTIFFAP